jgi:hypothetical protein
MERRRKKKALSEGAKGDCRESLGGGGGGRGGREGGGDREEEEGAGVGGGGGGGGGEGRGAAGRTCVRACFFFPLDLPPTAQRQGTSNTQQPMHNGSQPFFLNLQRLFEK